MSLGPRARWVTTSPSCRAASSWRRRGRGNTAESDTGEFMAERKRLYLIDGNSYVYRAFHAIRQLAN